jgi:hypothetical protein
LFEQTFGFTDLFFTLFRRGRKKFKFAADSRLMPNYQLDDNYVYKKQNSFKSNPKFRVKMLEETGLKFKFKFHTFQTDNHYTFDRLIYDFENLFPNFKNYFSYTKQKYAISENSNLYYFENFMTNVQNYETGQAYDLNFEQHQYPFQY